MVGTFDQQAAEIDVASLGDAELWVAIPGLTASWPQTEVAADIATSLEPFLAAQRQDIRQCREMAESLKEAAYLSNQLVDELMMSDLLVIACPMWNFGIPSSLKAWIDYIVRAGQTINYTG